MAFSEFDHMGILNFPTDKVNDVFLQTIDLDFGFLNFENEYKKLVSTLVEADMHNSAQTEFIPYIETRYKIKYKTILKKH